MAPEERSHQSHSSASDGSQGDSFWSAFERKGHGESDRDVTSIDAEIQRWSGLSSLSRTTDPVHAMDALKSDYPQICVFPSTQNRDERIFSLVAQNTRPQCRRIKVDTIENKVLIGSDIQSHGFIINYKDGNDSSSDEES